MEEINKGSKLRRPGKKEGKQIAHLKHRLRLTTCSSCSSLEHHRYHKEGAIWNCDRWDKYLVSDWSGHQQSTLTLMMLRHLSRHVDC